jgi:hypothetical protein
MIIFKADTPQIKTRSVDNFHVVSSENSSIFYEAFLLLS